MNRLWLLPVLFLLSSCSTIIDRTTQEVHFETPGARDSVCFLDTGTVSYRVYPPDDVILMKTDEELEVRCLADGNREKTIMVRPILSKNTLLNVSNAIVPGLAVDEHTKAHYLYPDVVAIDFTNLPYEKAAQPSHYLKSGEPNVEDIDPKKGGFPAIHESDMEDPAMPPERQSKSFYTEQPDAPAYQPSKPVPIK